MCIYVSIYMYIYIVTQSSCRVWQMFTADQEVQAAVRAQATLLSVRESERERARARKSERVIVSERERECVCERERVRECEGERVRE